MALSELIDTNTAYAAVEDVEDFFRAKSFDATTNPTHSRVQEKLLQVSEQVDSMTNRAWRARRTSNRELEARMSRRQERVMEQGVQSGRQGRISTRATGWAKVTLPHESIRPWDPNQGDTLEVLKPHSVEDITADQGREDGEWYIDRRKGVLHVALSNFRRGPSGNIRAATQQRPRVRVTYRHGRDPETTTTGDDVVQQVAQAPRDIRRATAMLCASDLIDSDQYSDLVPGGESSPDQGQASMNYQDEAEQIIQRYRYRVLL